MSGNFSFSFFGLSCCRRGAPRLSVSVVCWYASRQPTIISTSAWRVQGGGTCLVVGESAEGQKELVGNQGKLEKPIFEEEQRDITPQNTLLSSPSPS